MKLEWITTGAVTLKLHENKRNYLGDEKRQVADNFL